MVSWDVLQELRSLLQNRRIDAGIDLLNEHRISFEQLHAGMCFAGLAVGCLAQWVDVGFADDGLLEELLDRFPRTERPNLRLSDYVHLEMAEALVAMRREDLSETLRHLDTAITLSDDIEDPRIAAIASLWKARSLRKAGEYDQALELTRRGIKIAFTLKLPYVAAVMRTLESRLLFQHGESKEAVRILQEAETVLRDTDDFITLGNIQSSYGRIALREGRYDHAMQHFENSIELFKRRQSLGTYLARSLTNIAQAKRFLALQLRRSIDARWEQQHKNHEVQAPAERRDKARQLERMHELLHNAEADLMQADAIYRRNRNRHGEGNVKVNLALIYLDLGDMDRSDEMATEAFKVGATKADYLLMCRARIVQAMAANARFEEQIGDGDDDPSRYAQLALDCAREAVDLGERTQSRRLLAQAHVCHGTVLVNGFFNDSGGARACCGRAEAYLGHDRQDALWQEVEILRSRIPHAGIEDPNLRAWSQGIVGDKSLQQVVGEFEELLIRRVWEHEGRKVSRVAQRLSVSPKKVRRVVRHLGLLLAQPEHEEAEGTERS
jgi:tetratricopeptide (TPR) repeat protein